MQHTEAPVFRLNALCLLTWLQLGWKSQAGCATLHTHTAALYYLQVPHDTPRKELGVNNKQCYRKSKVYVIIQEFGVCCRHHSVYPLKVSFKSSSKGLLIKTWLQKVIFKYLKQYECQGNFYPAEISFVNFVRIIWIIITFLLPWKYQLEGYKLTKIGFKMYTSFF